MELPDAHAIRASVKRTGRALVTAGGFYALVRNHALRGDPVTVLMYHTLGADDEDLDAWTVVRRSDFERQIAFLRQHYAIVSLDEALAASDGDSSSRLPRAVLTFDDGHASLHEHLLPIVERERLPVTIYVATGHIESGRPYWFDRAMNALQTAVPTDIDLRGEGLGHWVVGGEAGARNWDGISAVLQALKSVAPERRERLCELVAQQAGQARTRRFAALAPLTREQLRDFAALPCVTLGAHTHCHNLLDQLPLEQASASIVKSRDLLGAWTGRSIDHFAYPNGNHNDALVREVERLGFRSAFTTRKGLWRRGTTRFAAPRVPVGRYDDLDKFKLELLGGLGRAS